jgi:hypothetical protein
MELIREIYLTLKENTMAEQMLAPEDQMMQWITSKWITKPIHVISELGIADLLRNGPLNVDILAEKTETHAHILYRVLRALAAVGIFTETQARVFGLTPLAECLLADRMRPLIRMFLSDWHEKAWSALDYTVRTGKPGFEYAFGQPAFEWMEANPDARATLDQGQGCKSTGFSQAVMEVQDFSGVESICDVGGGQGAFLISLLKKHPHLKGIVADLPGAVAAAEKAILNSDLKNRCQAVAYDFLEETPPVCDAYFLVNVLHDWDEDIGRRILKSISSSMKPDSKLWIVEFLLESGPGFSVAKLLDIEVLVMGSGAERSIGEYTALLGSVGLLVSRVIPINRGPVMMECILK